MCVQCRLDLSIHTMCECVCMCVCVYVCARICVHACDGPHAITRNCSVRHRRSPQLSHVGSVVVAVTCGGAVRVALGRADCAYTCMYACVHVYICRVCMCVFVLCVNLLVLCVYVRVCIVGECECVDVCAWMCVCV